MKIPMCVLVPPPSVVSIVTAIMPSFSPYSTAPAGIGEVLSLKLDDYQVSQRQLTVRVSKGREPRVIPVSKDCAEAIMIWMKVRKRIMANVPADEDEGWLFISETSGRIDEGRFLKTLKKYRDYAGLSKSISLHRLAPATASIASPSIIY